MSFRISACTIAKNEEKNIARSIESYKNYVDEGKYLTTNEGTDGWSSDGYIKKAIEDTISKKIYKAYIEL